MNRLNNCRNIYQGDFHKVLCVCSAGILRSATIAYVLSREPYNCNTRNCGIDDDFALIPIDRVLVEWSDSIVCADTEHHDVVLNIIDNFDIKGKKVYNFNLPDNFSYRDPDLVNIIETKLLANNFPTNGKH